MKRWLPLLGLLAACTLGPDYERPAFPEPEAFRSTEATQDSFGDLAWFEVYQDPVLQELITRALEQNYDVRVAAELVLEARSRVTITRSELFPDVEAIGDADFRRDTENGPVSIPPGTDRDSEIITLTGGVFWEIDFWGRVQRATEAARAELLATEMARSAVIQTLVADLAFAYFELLELDAELDISRRTLETREKSRELVSLRLDHGVANKVELRQAEGLVLTAEGLIPELELRIEQQENLISLLIGTNSGPVPRGRPLLEQTRQVSVPAGMSSQLLERRPDIRVAEEDLIAANARIGEAKALLYPTIGLTGVAGVASEELDDLFEDDSTTWTLRPSVTQQIFNAGRLRAGVEGSESRQRQATLLYLRTVQRAFAEVSDALVAHQKTREVRQVREEFEATLEDQTRLSHVRYRGGVTTYFELLDSQRDYFDAELDLARSIRDELLSTVLLYRALGGGWQTAQTLAASDAQEGASDASPIVGE